ncbi:MAG: DNA polymerase III subunit gamma/tau, partial [Pseudomonadales bacterium]|nr:DNA polymerase III subunit gamma/tau [Pseudomonadales bacterium]
SAALYDDDHRRRLQRALEEYFGREVAVAIETGALQAESPRAAALRAQRERQAAAVAALRADPVVGALVAQFDGVLLEETVVPLDD